MSDTPLAEAPPRRTLTATPGMLTVAQKLGIAPPPAPAETAKPPAKSLAPAAAERLDLRNRLVLALRRLAPELFAGLERDHPPLAVGIREEIMAAMPGTERSVLADVLRVHTRGPGYLTHLAAGAPRRHLDGTEAGTPAPDQQAYARVGVERLQRKRQGPKPAP